jgi:hypothetical protein
MRRLPVPILPTLLKALGYLLLLNLGAALGTLLAVAVYWCQLTTNDAPFWVYLMLAHLVFLVGALMFLVPLYGLACWLVPVMRRLWVPAVLGFLWTPVQFLNPIPIRGWEGFASLGLTSAVVVLVVLVLVWFSGRRR